MGQDGTLSSFYFSLFTITLQRNPHHPVDKVPSRKPQVVSLSEGFVLSTVGGRIPQ